MARPRPHPGLSLPAVLVCAVPMAGQGDAIPAAGETLHYRVEWRLVRAGRATFKWAPGAEGSRELALRLESTGLVSKLYKVDSTYTAQVNAGMCARSTQMIAHEGRKRRDTRVTYPSEQGKSSYVERDLILDTIVDTREVEVPACVHDALGALLKLRAVRLEKGESIQIPMGDGKKYVSARVEAQQKEKVSTPLGSFPTTRYEAFLFNNVLYRRRAHLYVWLTDDERRLPVQIRIRMQFQLGTVTFQLEKMESGTGLPAALATSSDRGGAL